MKKFSIRVTRGLQGNCIAKGRWIVMFVIYALSAGAQSEEPTFEFAKVTGSLEFTYVTEVAVDEFGNIFDAGTFYDLVDLDPGPGTAHVQQTSNNFFVRKLDTEGNFLWAKTFSATKITPVDIKTAPDGGIYVIGRFEGAVDFDPGEGQSAFTSQGDNDAFLLKLGSSGKFDWVRVLSNARRVSLYSLALDGSGNPHIGGSASGLVTIDTGSGSTTFTTNGYGFLVAKFQANGNFKWARTFGHLRRSSYAQDITVDFDGNVITVAEVAYRVDLDPGPEVFLFDGSRSDWTHVVHKLDEFGNFLWARELRAEKSDFTAVAVDSSGGIVTTGYFRGIVDFDPGPGVFELDGGSGAGAFIWKLDASGGFSWVRSFSGRGSSYMWDIGIDEHGDVYTLARFGVEVDLDPGLGEDIVDQDRSYHAFIHSLDENGNYNWALGFGSRNAGLRGYSMAFSSVGDIVVTGTYTDNPDMDPGPAEYILPTPIDRSDAFLVKFVQPER